MLVSAFVVGLIGFSTTFEHITGINLPIDELFTFNREWGAMATTAPGRMGPPAAASWAILSLAIYFTGSRRRQLGPHLGLLVLVIASQSLIGAMYGASPLYMLPSVTALSLQTSTFLFALGLRMLPNYRRAAGCDRMATAAGGNGHPRPLQVKWDACRSVITPPF
ncbi:MAG: hypothetical protein H0V76_00100 [Blastocatellia bacterium]|nr:hypothetical protein [Blastocatellia bacterium]